MTGAPWDSWNGPPFWQSESGQRLLELHPQLEEMAAYFPSDLGTEIFPGQAEIELLSSSYKVHGYGYLFYALTRVLKPEQCVEIGVLQGFSLFTSAAGLRDNEAGTINGFDLFEDYAFRHDSYTAVAARLEAFGLGAWANAAHAEAGQVNEMFDEVDYLHVDISNDGDVYRTVFSQWADKVTKVMLLEGGSPARDEVEWMVKYEKPPIVDALAEIRETYPQWDIVVLEPYPSLTLALPSR
jgi:hypothetical protein